MATNKNDRIARLSRAAGLLIGLGLVPAAAFAQDAGYATVEAESGMGPLDIPGRETGERSRLEVKPLERQHTEAAPEPPDWFGGKPWWEWSSATGNWGGARAWLDDRGFSFNGSYTLDWNSVWNGGIRNRASTRSLTDFNLTVDMEKFVGLKGGTFFLDFYSTDGRGGLEDSGDFVGYTNIATTRNLDQLAEVWYEHWFFDDHVRVKVGKVDANLEFGFVRLAPAGINSSIAVPTPILGFPTYPDPATSVNIFLYPTDNIYLGFGLYDGATTDGFPTGHRGPATFFSDTDSDTWFFIGEAGLTWNALGGLGSGRLTAGGWGHTAEFARFDGSGTDEGTEGFYIIAEQQLITRGDTQPLADQGLFVYAKYAWADDDVALAAQHFGAGILQRGTFADRENDEAGIYVGWVDFSNEDGVAIPNDETAVELYYALALTPFITLTPSLQYIFSPSGRDEIDDAVIGSLRVKISF